MASGTVEADQQRLLRPSQKFKYVIVVESRTNADSSWPASVVSVLKLNNRYYFPDDKCIATSTERQKWAKDQPVNINWPDDGTGTLVKGLINIVQVKVHDLYVDEASAKKAEKILLQELSEKSMERERQQQVARNTVVDSSDGDGDNETDEESRDEEPPRKRQKVAKGRSSTTGTSSTNGTLSAAAATNDELLRQVISMLEDKKRSDATRDANIQKLTDLVHQLIKSQRETGKKLDSNSRQTSNINRQLTGKVASRGPVLRDVDALFDSQTNPITYMGIDRTEEVNQIFRTCKSKNDFIRDVARKFYGDDLYFWMFEKDKSSSGDSNLRNSMEERDPDGAVQIKKILSTFWEVAVWTENVENVKKSLEIESASHENAIKLRAELASLKRSERENWMTEAIKLMNKWGNDAKGRPISFFPWTKSLFGMSVVDPRATKPANYDPAKETEFRKLLLSRKKHEKRTNESFLPELQDQDE